MIFESKYDEHNNLIEEKRINKNTKDILIQKWEYNEQGNKTRYIVIEKGEKTADWIWKYDDSGNLIYHEKRDGKGEVEDWESYEWYDNGQKKMSNTRIIPSGRSVLEYDKDGNLVESKELSEDESEVEYWEKYYYNDNNEKVKEIWGRKGVKNGYIEYKYDNIKVYKNK